MESRPAIPLRIAVLIAAIACLGLTMCVRADKKQPQAPANQQAAPVQQQQQQAPQPNPPPRPEYFPATKAPGGMYR